MNAAILYLKSSAVADDPRPSAGVGAHRGLLTQHWVIGDAHVLFLNSPEACSQILAIAENLVLHLDRENLRNLSSPRLHFQIGIAAGPINPQQPLGSKVFTTAKTLCEWAANDEVWLDLLTKLGSQLEEHRFAEIEPQNAYRLRIRRLINSTPTDFFGHGIVALYPNRQALFQDFRPARLVALAAKGSTLLIAGRTLVSWTRFLPELQYAARSRQISFQFLLSSPQSCQILGQQEQEEIERDSRIARKIFRELAAEKPVFEVKETDQVVVDGVTCVRVMLPGEPESGRERLLIIQDVNAAPGMSKPSLLFACPNIDAACDCMAHGLYKRTLHRFWQAKELPAAPRSRAEALVHASEGLSSRNNRPAHYVARLAGHFAALQALEAGENAQVPPPLCVQLQVSGICSTHCVMCDHHLSREVGLNLEQWKRIFRALKDFGVTSCIFSGGEPLMRPDIGQLLRAAAQGNGLHVGLLTNGTMASNDKDFRELLLDAIYDSVSWVAISIDGRPDADSRIRNPIIGEPDRVERLKEFCQYFHRRKSSENYRQFISATVTLQKGNIGTNLRTLCDFIQQDLGIHQVNFKLATGARTTLARPPEFLLDQNDLEKLEQFLWQSALTDEDGNNLDYLRRCFAQGIFTIGDAADGVPLRTFYENQGLRCFTPFLFALIDIDGEVYPCCHLYRDNHGADPMSRGLRAQHSLGNALTNTFQDIWSGGEFDRKRRDLRVITMQGKYQPCGECTRHCQHNLALNQIYREFEKDPEFLHTFEVDDGPVWL